MAAWVSAKVTSERPSAGMASLTLAFTPFE